MQVRLISLILLFAVSLSAPANAQLFEFLGGLFGGPARVVSPSPDENVQSGVSSSFGYCVRTCDGAFFPLSKLEGRSTPEQLCGMLCPAVPTKVFFGSQIDTSVTKSGEPYSKLKNAFLYRQSEGQQCACTYNGGGVAQIDVKEDPTLKSGDIVVTEEGLRVFKGSNSFPYRVSDFAPTKIPLIQITQPSRTHIYVQPRPELSYGD